MVRVKSLIGGLRSYKLQGVAKKKFFFFFHLEGTSLILELYVTS